MDEKLFEQDLEVLSSAYRLIADASAFDDLVAAWDARIQLSDVDASTSSTLLRHLKKVQGLLDASPVQTYKDPVEQVVRSVAVSAMVLTVDGMVVDLNQAAAVRFGLRQGTQTDFSWLDPSSRSVLTTLRGACRRFENGRLAIVRINDAVEQQLAELFVIADKEHTEGLLALRVLEVPWTPAVQALLAELFDLTEAEIDICRLLYQHRDATRIAAARSTSIRTVRTQLSSILNKTQTTSQVDLIRLLAFVCSRVDRGRASRLSGWRDPYNRERTFVGRHGVTIAHSWIGDPHGKPVVLLHGIDIGYAMAPQMDEVFKRAGLRIIFISRPGHGNSAPDPDRGSCAANCRAVLELLDHLRIRACVGVGLGFATIPLIELASQHPNRVRGLISIGGIVDLTNADAMRRLPVTHRTFLTLQKQTPWAMELFAKAGLRAMRQDGADWYLTRAYAESPLDLDVISRPNVRALLSNACARLVAQGHTALGRDLELFLHDWRSTMAAMHAPMLIVQGEQDRTAPLAEVEKIARDFANVELTVLRDSAELIFYDRPFDIAEAIIAFEARL